MLASRLTAVIKRGLTAYISHLQVLPSWRWKMTATPQTLSASSMASPVNSPETPECCCPTLLLSLNMPVMTFCHVSTHTGFQGWRVEFSRRSDRGPPPRGGMGSGPMGGREMRCYECGEIGHIARDCRNIRGGGGGGGGGMARGGPPPPRGRSRSRRCGTGSVLHVMLHPCSLLAH